MKTFLFLDITQLLKKTSFAVELYTLIYKLLKCLHKRFFCLSLFDRFFRIKKTVFSAAEETHYGWRGKTRENNRIVVLLF